MKKIFTKVKGFVKKHPVKSVAIGVGTILLGLVALNARSTGTYELDADGNIIRDAFDEYDYEKDQLTRSLTEEIQGDEAA